MIRDLRDRLPLQTCNICGRLHRDVRLILGIDIQLDNGDYAVTIETPRLPKNERYTPYRVKLCGQCADDLRDQLRALLQSAFQPRYASR